jgi:DNA-binding CsgD family transcriptional regulator
VSTHDAARAAIEDACATARSLRDVFAGTAAALTRAVPSDAYCLNSLDPGTLQETFAHHSFEPKPDVLARFFEIEASADNVNAVSTLADDPFGAATLHETTGGDPARSARYRDVLVPLGLARELRVVIRDRGVPWGVVNLFRGGDSPDFSVEEAGFVASLGRTLADGIRRTLLLGAVDTQPDAAPGVLVIDLAHPNRTLHRSPVAARWLDDLDDADWHVARVAQQALAGGGTAAMRVCSRRGRWLTLHAEPYGDPAGTLVSVVVEPTRPAELARLVVDAYGLSAREREIVQLLAHGHTNAEISRLLRLSAHTVGDHVKSIFAKLAVHSRAELTSRLYFGPPPARPVRGSLV